MGIILWTFVEYTLHRWVFHLDIKNQSPPWCTFHFLLHGLHHKVPFDPHRLVFPPVPAMLIAISLYQPITVLHSDPLLIMGGTLLGKPTSKMPNSDRRSRLIGCDSCVIYHLCSFRLFGV